MERNNRHLATFKTGRMATEIYDRGDLGFEWIRTPGPLARVGELVSYNMELMSFISAEPFGRVKIITPVPRGDSISYKLPAPYSAAYHLLSRSSTPGDYIKEIQDLSGTLANLHNARITQDGFSASSQTIELMEWIDSGYGSKYSALFHVELRTRIGVTRFEWLRSAIHDLLDSQSPSAILGNPGIGTLIPSSTETVIVAGPSIGVGAREVDLGSVLGQLFELSQIGDGRQRDHLRDQQYDDLRDAFVQSYEGCFDRAKVARSAVLYLVNHLRVFVTYGSWHEQVLMAIDLIGQMIDDEGLEAVPIMCGAGGESED